MNGPLDVSTAASSGPASAGIVSDRSPSPSSTLVAGGHSHSSGPGVTASSVVRSIVGATSGRSRVAGWRFHVSRAIQRSQRRRDRGGRRRRPGRARPSTPAGIDARSVAARAATASSTAWRTAWCQAGAITPIVRCDDAASTVSAACGKPRGRYRQSPARSVRSIAGSPSSSNVGIGSFGPLRTGCVRAGQRLPHPPPLAPVELQHEHVVEVEVQLQALGRRRRQVGVDLHGVAEVEGQVVGQPGQAGIAELQPLQHHRGPGGVQLEHAVGLDDVVERAVADAGLPARVRASTACVPSRTSRKPGWRSPRSSASAHSSADVTNPGRGPPSPGDQTADRKRSSRTNASGSGTSADEPGLVGMVLPSGHPAP